jgi:predicted NAD/FAD-dependent oxidoreductase
VAVIGVGLAGAACAASLKRNGLDVTLFDKSRGLGGRMATRRLRWSAQPGADDVAELHAEVDHGAQYFVARHPRFRVAMQRAASAGVLVRWQPLVHGRWTSEAERGFVPVPDMPALCRHLVDGMPLQLEHAVQRLHRQADGWQLVLAEGGCAGPFDLVVLALPPAQAAVLLAGHHDMWADALAEVRMQPCWTLMAVTDDVDWPWDAAEPDRGPLAWVARNDRKPGRRACQGRATWVAQATAAWSSAHLEEDTQVVAAALRGALQALLPATRPVRWFASVVHRWRYAVPVAPAAGAAPATREAECRWDPALGIGVCGDHLAGGGVEAAWRSGDELADAVVAWLESLPEPASASGSPHPAVQ